MSADQRHALALTEARERVGESRAVGQRELGGELEQRDEDEAPPGQLGMRERQPLRAQLELAEQQHVDVERPRPVARGPEHPPVLDLDRLADVEQAVGGQLGVDARRRVEKVGLVEHLSDRRGLVHGRHGVHVDAMARQRLDACAQVRRPVPLVRPQPKVTNQLSSASSSPPSAGRSWVTSTAASSIASGSGGSGFAARTLTVSHPNRSMRRSAITWQRRSSVR